MKDKEFIEKVLELDKTCEFTDEFGDEISKLIDQYLSERKIKYRSACGSCKYFKEVEYHNKLWFTCKHSKFRAGRNKGEYRFSYKSLGGCPDHVLEVEDERR